MSNYIEYVLGTSSSYNIAKTDFVNILTKHSRLSQGTRQFTRYFYDDLVYECSNNDSSRTYRKIPVASTCGKPLIKNEYTKENVPFYMFPSTNRLLEVMDVECVTIRFHGSVFLNFETQTFDKGNTVVYKIFVNHNVETRDDPDTVQKHITRAISLLQ